MWAPMNLVSDGWNTNLDAAITVAQKEKKNLMIDFTGSDWCGYCKQLDSEVFSTARFKDWSKKFVRVRLDYPRTKIQPTWLINQNMVMMNHFQIQGFPTVLVVSPDGVVLAKTGVLPQHGADIWMQVADEMVARSTAKMDAAKKTPASAPAKG